MTTPTEKNHNKHLDLLHDYKIHLIKYITELEKMDRQSEFAKKWRSNNQVSACINGLNIINVRMYTNFKDIWLGFEKNSYPYDGPGFEKSFRKSFKSK